MNSISSIYTTSLFFSLLYFCFLSFNDEHGLSQSGILALDDSIKLTSCKENGKAKVYIFCCILYFPSIGGRSWYWHISTQTHTCGLSDFVNVSNVFTFLTVTCFNGAFSLPCAFGGRSAEIRHPFTQHTFGRSGSCKLRKMAPLLNVPSASAAGGGGGSSPKMHKAVFKTLLCDFVVAVVIIFLLFINTCLPACSSACCCSAVLQTIFPFNFILCYVLVLFPISTIEQAKIGALL